MVRGVTEAGEVDAEFFLHFAWRKSDEAELIGVKDLFATLLQKSSTIATPLQFFTYTGSFEPLDRGESAATAGKRLNA